jgi:hypothetical protein
MLLQVLIVASLARPALAIEASAEIGSPAIVDLGTVAAGSETPVGLTLVNPTDRDLRIGAVHSNCDCTTVSAPTDAIPAGQSAPLRILLRAPLGGGPTESLLDVDLDPPAPEPWRITLRAEVRQLLDIQPTSLDLGIIRATGAPLSTQMRITLTNPGNAPVEVGAISASPEWLTVASRRLTLAPGATETVTAGLTTPSRPGTLQGTIRFDVVSPEARALDVPVFLDLVGGVVVIPEPVSFGDVPPGQVLTRTLSVTGAVPTSFQVLEARSSQPGLSAEIARVGTGQYQVTLTLDTSAAGPGPIHAALELRTNDPVTPNRTVAITGTVQQQ